MNGQQVVKSFRYLLTDPPQFDILQTGPGRDRMQFDQLRRREFITLLGAAATWPLAARVQQGELVRRIGVLMNLASDEGQPRLAAFVQDLQQLGWRDGRKVRIDYRWAAGD